MEKITFDFKNRTALVTGGAQGFGLDIAKRFLKSGAKVIIWDIDPNMLKKATNEINKLLKMENEFPIFMAVVDIAWFRPDIIKPESHVPTGIGAVAYLDILQSYLKLNNHNETCDKMISLQQEY